jgi:hypothetical protein
MPLDPHRFLVLSTFGGANRHLFLQETLDWASRRLTPSVLAARQPA